MLEKRILGNRASSPLLFFSPSFESRDMFDFSFVGVSRVWKDFYVSLPCCRRTVISRIHFQVLSIWTKFCNLASWPPYINRCSLRKTIRFIHFPELEIRQSGVSDEGREPNDFQLLRERQVQECMFPVVELR